MSDSTQRGFPRGADGTPDAIEMSNYIVATSPATVGVYAPRDHTAHVFTRKGDVLDGYVWQSFGLTSPAEADRSGRSTGKGESTVSERQVRRVSLLGTEETNLEGLLGLYARLDTPIPDMTAQYEVYRRRISCTSPSYPGDLFLRWHSSTVGATAGTLETRLYLAALLGVDPLRTFGTTASAGEAKVSHLLRRVQELAPLLRRDLDRRGA
jgi:hypothetical protein